MLCVCRSQGDGHDLCPALPASRPDAAGAGGRDPQTDSQDRAAGDGAEPLQEAEVSLSILALPRLCPEPQHECCATSSTRIVPSFP